MGKIIGIFIYYISIFFSKIIKKNDNWIIMGGWNGQAYLDNTKYLMEYMLKNTSGYKLIWVGDKVIKNYIEGREGIVYCKRNSLKSFYYIFKSKYIFVSHSLVDISRLPIFIDNIKILTDHGIPIKKWGLDDQRFVSKNLKKDNYITKVYKKIVSKENRFDYFVSASRLNDKCICSAEKNWGAVDKALLKTGTPRNDYLFNLNDKSIEKLKNRYSKQLGFEPNKKIILYAPTFRRTGSNIENIAVREDKKEIEYLEMLLDKYNYVFIEKNHFATFKQKGNKNTISQNNRICLGSEEEIDIQELLAITDVLISDYSGVFLDYTILDRPIINFVFDYDYYKDIDSGLYYNVNEFSAGKVAYRYSEVIDEMEKLFKGIDKYRDKRIEIRNKFLEYENGNASEKILKKVLQK